MAFWESLGANGILALAYAAWQLIDRCMNSKCRYTKEAGLEYDLGDPAECPATDMAQLAELIKARSLHHLTKKVNV